jgi:dephospho-CoA kinase
MKVLGITGGIGSGKSTVSKLLEKKGAIVLDADQISRDLTSKKSDVMREIAHEFGEEVVLDNGSLNRDKMAKIVFRSEESKIKLEAIIHKVVIQTFDKIISDLKESFFHGVVVLDVPIPVERGFLDVCDEIWSVSCSEQVRVDRVVKRSGIAAASVSERIRAQMGNAGYDALATYSLHNDGSLKELEQKVDKLWDDFLIKYVR